MRRWVIPAAVLVLALAAFVFVQQRGQVSAPVPSVLVTPPSLTTTSDVVTAPAAGARVETVATGLEVPWAVAFASDGVLYVTERPGRLLRLRNGVRDLTLEVPGVVQRTESGLLGLALDPDFGRNRLVYLYYTYGNGNQNRLVRYTLTETALTDERILVENIPGSPFHDGGRIAFGPDGNLYVTTGDAGKPELAQTVRSLAGKILRIRPDGSIPEDNPFPSSPVYSYGHRNPQGLAWAADGTLYVTEHGPSTPVVDCCHDEVNRIEKGKNYGWPMFTGRRQRAGGRMDSDFVMPIAESGDRDTWAPAGAAISGETLYFAGLRGEALYALDLKNLTSIRSLFKNKFGRIREVLLGLDNMLYLTTSNRDGRGNPAAEDDRILRIDPAVLK